MEPEDIRALRKRLGLTMRELADRLGIEQAAVIAWEHGDRYPTKKHVAKMQALESAASAGAAPPARKDLYAGLLSEPRFFAAFRKLLAYEALQQEFLKLADRFDDPANP